MQSLVNSSKQGVSVTGSDERASGQRVGDMPLFSLASLDGELCKEGEVDKKDDHRLNRRKAQALPVVHADTLQAWRSVRRLYALSNRQASSNEELGNLNPSNASRMDLPLGLIEQALSSLAESMRSVALPKSEQKLESKPKLNVLSLGKQDSGGSVLAGVKDLTPEQSYLRVRMMVESGQAWTYIALALRQWVEKTPSCLNVAKAMELVLLHADTAEIGDWLHRAYVLQPGFVLRLHPRIRRALWIYLWSKKDWLEPYITVFARGLTSGERAEESGEQAHELSEGVQVQQGVEPQQARACDFADQTSEVERWALFLWYWKHDQRLCAFEFFCNHERSLLAAMQWFEDQNLRSPCFADVDELYWNVGHLAFQEGKKEQAQRWLGAVSPLSMVYPRAVRLLEEVERALKHLNETYVQEILGRKQDAAGRLSYVYGYFRDLEADSKTCALAEDHLRFILADPLSWLPKEQQALADYARLLVSKRRLKERFPMLFELFYQVAWDFGFYSIDEAVWSVCAELEPEESQDAMSLVTLSALHLCLGQEGFDEDRFWRARSMLTQDPLEDAWAYPGWSAVLEKLKSALDRRPRWSQEERDRALKCFAVSSELDRISVDLVAPYMGDEGGVHPAAWPVLEQAVGYLQDAELELQFLELKVRKTYLVNAQVDRIYRMALAREKTDLAWRCATVLRSRKALREDLLTYWELSLENRQHYPYHVPDQVGLQTCLSGFSKQERGLLECLFWLGPKLHHLLSLYPDKRKVTLNSQKHPGVLVVDRFLTREQPEDHPFSAKRLTHTSLPAQLSPLEKPPIGMVLPECAWTQVLTCLSEKSGWLLWGWNIEALSICLQEETRAEYGLRKDRRWQKKLTPQERILFYRLQRLCPEFTQEKVKDLLACFLLRLTTWVYPNHKQALKVVQETRGPLAYLRDLERFILSEAYSKARSVRGLARSTSVPERLRDQGAWIKL